MSRKYDNSLRARRAEMTRQTIVDVGVQLLGEQPDVDLKVAVVAERAGVSVPTVYRYFGGREGLLVAIDEALSKDTGVPRDFAADEVVERIPQVQEWFADNVPLIRAVRASRGRREVYEHARRTRDETSMAGFAPLVQHLTPEQGHAVSAFMRVAFGADAFLQLVDRFEIDPDDAKAASQWAFRALIDQLEREGGNR